MHKFVNYRRSVFAASLLLAIAACERSAAAQSTYDVVVAGMQCEQRRGSLACTYAVGRDLRFEITGVGEADTGVHFVRSMQDGDFYASFGVQHGCVIVWPGHGDRSAGNEVRAFERGLAFVSPTTGKVYTTWPECARANGKP